MTKTNNTLKGKKLLILGGSSYMIDPVRKAKEMGVYTVVTDLHGIDRCPAKLIADEYWDISLMDYDTLVPKIKNEMIDGILTGFTDAFLLAYQHLCELSGLPCYATKEQFELSIDKDEFKKLCRNNGVGVVPEYDISCFDRTVISKNNPVIIKPVDNSGSNGIFICDDPNDFDRLKKDSLSYSRSGKVLVEKYMQCDDVSFEYKIQDGEITLSSICDRFIHNTPGVGSVTSGLIYPSKYLARYRAEQALKVVEMFRSIGLKNGVLFLQAFVDDNGFYFYEMGYRLSGGRHYVFTENQNDDSSLIQLINFALTGEMDSRRISEIASPDFKDICCQLSVLCRSAKIERIIGKDLVQAIPEVIDSLFSFREGDTIGKEGTSSQIFAKLHIVAHSFQDLKRVLSSIKDCLHVFDENNQDIIIDFFEIPHSCE